MFIDYKTLIKSYNFKITCTLHDKKTPLISKNQKSTFKNQNF